MTEISPGELRNQLIASFEELNALSQAVNILNRPFDESIDRAMEIAQGLPPGYSVGVFVSPEVTVGLFGGEGSAGGIIHNDGSIHNVAGISGMIEFGAPFPASIEVEFHLVKGRVDEFTGYSFQLEGALVHGSGINLSLTNLIANAGAILEGVDNASDGDLITALITAPQGSSIYHLVGTDLAGGIEFGHTSNVPPQVNSVAQQFTGTVAIFAQAASNGNEQALSVLQSLTSPAVIDRIFNLTEGADSEVVLDALYSMWDFLEEVSGQFTGLVGDTINIASVYLATLAESLGLDWLRNNIEERDIEEIFEPVFLLPDVSETDFLFVLDSLLEFNDWALQALLRLMASDNVDVTQNADDSQTIQANWWSDVNDDPNNPYLGTLEVETRSVNEIEEFYDSYEIGFYDPLILDLDGDGIETISYTDNSSNFDMFSEAGLAADHGWISPDDGFLAIDDNENGIIDNIGELFGDRNTSGFAELSRHDSNGDGVIDKQDQIFSDLLIWQDMNGDGFSQIGELYVLSETQIVSISLDVVDLTQINNDNIITEFGSFSYADGTSGTVGNVKFTVDFSTLQAIEEHDSFVFGSDNDRISIHGSASNSTLSGYEKNDILVGGIVSMNSKNNGAALFHADNNTITLGLGFTGHTSSDHVIAHGNGGEVIACAVLFDGIGTDRFIFPEGGIQDAVLDFTPSSEISFFDQGEQIAIQSDSMSSFEDAIAVEVRYSAYDPAFDFGNGNQSVLKFTELAAFDNNAFSCY